MEIVVFVVVYILGIATGMYAASQIEEDIDKRIEPKDNYESFVKKHYKK